LPDSLTSKPSIASVSFDSTGGAVSIGTTDNYLTIWDTETGKQLREIPCYAGKVNAVSWNRSKLAPYLITSSGLECAINHDVRVKDPYINKLALPGNPVSLSWNCNENY